MGDVRTIPADWYPGTIPNNVRIDPAAYLETTYSFIRYRSELPVGVQLGQGAAAYLGTMFDIGPRGRVDLGDYVMSNGVWFICDSEITVGRYTMFSWNVVVMDTYRVPFDARQRRQELQRVPTRKPRQLQADVPNHPISIGSNVWVGFDVCILPGVTIGDGSVVGARSVVIGDIPPNCIAAGNPARVIRTFTVEEQQHGD
jgi:acetyltransferase-like isoleucine patch superfamily enzyme